MSSIQQTNVTLYPAPEGLAPSDACQVLIEDEAAFVYPMCVNVTHGETNVTTTVPAVFFDLNRGSVTVRIERAKPFKDVLARPLRLGIRPTVIDECTVEFTLNGPEKVTLEFDQTRGEEVHVFANAPEQHAPDPDDANVQYFGPGVHHVGKIELRSGGSVYLAGGAVVYGWIEGKDVCDCAIYGRGILDGRDDYAEWLEGETPLAHLPEELVHNRLRLENCERVTVRDVCLADSPFWTCKSISSRDLTFTNVKLFGGRNNTDGFDICGCQRVTISNCFTRVWDDSVALKTFKHGPVEDITVIDSQFWNDHAQSLEIGFELEADHVRNVLFRNIDILHNYWGGVLTIHNGNRAVVENVRYDDIRIEDAHAWIVEHWIGESHWLEGEERGHIRDIEFNNVRVLGHYDKERVLGFFGHDAEHRIEGVRFKDFVVNGRKIESVEDVPCQRNTFADAPEFE